MTEEEYFRKTYPDSCYGDRPLSPHFDFFQDGVEFGERQSEKKIAELEQQIEKMKCCGNCSHRHYWGNELGCNLDYDKEEECIHNNKKYWKFEKE